MCGFSKYCQSNILNHVFGKCIFSSPEVYIGLLMSEPNKDGSSISEPECQSYIRISTNAVDWSNAFEGSIQNVSDIIFAMACENWGKITHFALFDATTNGNMLAYGNLRPSKNINSGDIPRFAPGDLVIRLD